MTVVPPVVCRTKPVVRLRFLGTSRGSRPLRCTISDAPEWLPGKGGTTAPAGSAQFGLQWCKRAGAPVVKSRQVSAVASHRRMEEMLHDICIRPSALKE